MKVQLSVIAALCLPLTSLCSSVTEDQSPPLLRHFVHDEYEKAASGETNGQRELGGGQGNGSNPNAIRENSRLLKNEHFIFVR